MSQSAHDIIVVMNTKWASIRRGTHTSTGFTVVELVVIVSVIGILVGIVAIGYGSWRQSTDASALQSDLLNAAAAMESKVNFSDSYPAQVASVYAPSEGVILEGGAVGTSNYCVSGTRSGVSYFVTKQKVTLPGTCPTIYFDPSANRSYPGTWFDVTDISANGNDAIFREALTDNAYGPTYVSNDAGGVLEFDGTDKYYTTDPMSYGPNTTWMACAKTMANLNSFNMFMGSYFPYFGTHTNGTGIVFSNRISGTQRTISSATPATSLNTWNCYAFTTSYNGTSTTMKIFVNGEVRATGTYAGQQDNLNYGFAVGDGYPNAPAPSGVWYPFRGRVADVAIYPRTLTDGEIKGMFEALRVKFNI